MKSEIRALDLSPPAVKQCCAALYESDVARVLLGESFHPGGARLTQRLGEILSLSSRSRVLDVATGKGTSAMFLARTFGCEVVGIDYSQKNVDDANREAKATGLNERVFFQQADAEQLAFPDMSFDAIICECAFCTFPDKRAAAHEFARVLRVGGQVGLSDLTRDGALPAELDGLLSWISCIADAQPLTTYVALLRDARLTVRLTEEHNSALVEFVNQIRTRLLAAEIMVGLKKLALPDVDFESAKNVAKRALQAIAEGRLGYAVVTAGKAV